MPSALCQVGWQSVAFGCSKFTPSLVYLELNIALVLDERSVPWHRLVLFRQLNIKLPMCRPIDLHALVFSIRVTLIGIKESVNLCVRIVKPA